MGRLILAVAITGLFLGFALGQSGQAGELSGRLVNKTPGGKVPSGLEVSVMALGERGHEVRAKAQAGPGGQFSFSGLVAEAPANYVVSTSYQGVNYSSEPVTLSAKEPRRNLELAIYETSRDSSNIRIKNLHLVVSVNPGYLVVGYVVLLENVGNRTFKPGEKGGEEGLRLPLPAGYTQASLAEGANPDNVKANPEGIILAEPFSPGNRQLFISFKMAYHSSSLRWSQKVAYPTEGLDLFLPQGRVRLTSEQLKEIAPVQIRGQAYRRFRATSVSPASLVSLEFSELPRVQTGFKWPLAIGFALLLFAGLVYSLVNHGDQGKGGPPAGEGRAKGGRFE